LKQIFDWWNDRIRLKFGQFERIFTEGRFLI
jgi:hypothetical protein